MEVTMRLRKTDLSTPTEVLTTINELVEWRSRRIENDLPVGALDHAIAQLKSYRKFLGFVYLEELNQ